MTRWNRSTSVLLAAAAGLGLARAGQEWISRAREADLAGFVVIVTGGTRGLGYLLAREFIREGCKVAICAREVLELERAERELQALGGEVIAVRCDVTDRTSVGQMIDTVVQHFGRIDILVNNAGMIEAGPIETMTVRNFELAMDVTFWGMLYPILSVLPHMRAGQRGHIVNVTSFGGKIAVPHMVPYCAAKFAATGLSEGLRTELGFSPIRVTTIIPGLMRTGSHVNAFFSGDKEREFAWFGLGASLPLLSMDAEDAAVQIVKAVRRGDGERILTLPARVLTKMNGLFPGAVSFASSVVNHVLPNLPDKHSTGSTRGMDLLRAVETPLYRLLTALGRSASKRFNQYPGPLAALAEARQRTGRPAVSRRDTMMTDLRNPDNYMDVQGEETFR